MVYNELMFENNLKVKTLTTSGRAKKFIEFGQKIYRNFTCDIIYTSEKTGTHVPIFPLFLLR